MAKTKQLRAIIEDAKIIEQTSRELSAKLQEEVKVSEIIKGLIKYVPEVEKEIVKNRTRKTSNN